MGATAIHVYLVEHGKADTVVLFTEGTDFIRRARLLLTELVTRETKNLQPLGLQGFIQTFQSLVLGGKPAFAGRIDDQQHLALKLGQGLFFTTQGGGAVIIDPHVLS